MQRVAVYIDGFNLYYGLKSKREGSRGKRWPCYYWLDIRRMSERLLQPNQELNVVRYFTARVRHQANDPEKVQRQNTFIEAIATLPSVTIEEGYFVEKSKKCSNCGAKYKDFEEKMTDVNIAMRLLNDAQDGVFDTAIIVSADSDLAGPVEEVRKRYPGKRVVAAFPPDRHSSHLRRLANGAITIRQETLRRSRLPERVVDAQGNVLERPASWA